MATRFMDVSADAPSSIKTYTKHYHRASVGAAEIYGRSSSGKQLAIRHKNLLNPYIALRNFFIYLAILACACIVAYIIA